MCTPAQRYGEYISTGVDTYGESAAIATCVCGATGLDSSGAISAAREVVIRACSPSRANESAATNIATTTPDVLPKLLAPANAARNGSASTGKRSAKKMSGATMKYAAE